MKPFCMPQNVSKCVANKTSFNFLYLCLYIYYDDKVFYYTRNYKILLSTITGGGENPNLKNYKKKKKFSKKPKKQTFLLRSLKNISKEF